MKLIMSYVEGDGCTYHCDVVLPIEHESTESALEAFEQAVKTAYAKGMQNRFHDRFVFSGHSFSAEMFVLSPGKLGLPSFYTFEEWFEANAGTETETVTL